MIKVFAKHLLIHAFSIIITYPALAQESKTDSLQVVLKTQKADTNRVNTLLELCRIQSSSGAKNIEQTAQEALLLARKINFEKGQAHSDVYLALYYKKTGNALKAIEFLLKALKHFEKIQDANHVAACFNNIGVIYLNQSELEEALDHFKRAYSVWCMINYKPGIVSALNNMGSVYEKEKMDSLALSNYTRALTLCEEIKDKPFTSQILNSIGMIHFRRRDYETSMTFQKRALQLAIETNDASLQAQSLGAMSELYAALNLPEKALAMARKALESASETTSEVDLLDSYYRIYKAYEKLNNFKKAYEFQSLYIALYDSLRNSKNLGSIEKIKSRYELDKKDAEIVHLAQHNQVENFRRNIFIIALIVLLVIGSLLYNRYRLTTEKRLALKKQQLNFYIRILMEKSESINRINHKLELFKSNILNEDVQVAKIDKILQSNIVTDQDWLNFKNAFEEIYPAFFSKLFYKYPTLTGSEVRLSALIKLNLSLKETAIMLGISPESVKTSRYRLKKKFGLMDNETVEDVLEKLNTEKLNVPADVM